MVRLKASEPPKNLAFCQISIPYGAIKRLTGKNNYLKFSKISIPYGAIKRQFLECHIFICLYFNSLWCD